MTRLQELMKGLDPQEIVAIGGALQFAKDNPDFTARFGTFGQDGVRKLLDPANKARKHSTR